MNRFTFPVIILSLLAIGLLDNSGFSQRATYLPVQKYGENQLLKGDTAVFLLDGYKLGQIQWQQAEDGESWVDIPGQTADSLKIVPSQSAWYRAVIFDGTCDPCFSENFSVTVLEKEEIILFKTEEIFPEQIRELLENHFAEMSEEDNYNQYLDSIDIAIDSLKVTIQENFTLDEYQTIFNNTVEQLNNLESEKSTTEDCSDWGYSKGVKINISVSGAMGAIVVGGLQAAGGGGVKIVYDFVNFDRQLYYYTFCSSGFTVGAGLAFGTSGHIGFTGIYELITGIRYYGNTSGINKFAGASVGRSHTISGSWKKILGLDVSATIGSSTSAIVNFSNIPNFGHCPSTSVILENGVKSHSFAVSGSLSYGPAIELLVAYNNNQVFSNSHGVEGSYHKFSGIRELAGLKMAKELLDIGPMQGILTTINPVDIAASAVAIVYSYKNFSNCPAKLPTIGTMGVSEITSTGAMSGGVIRSDGGANVTSRGVIYSRNISPSLIGNVYTNNGSGIGQYTSQTSGLLPNTTYYARAYATNSAGTAYGSPVEFTTLVSGDPPVANFVGTPTTGKTPLTVTFNDRSTNNSTSWSWNFGDGNTSTAQNPQHTYVNPGNFTVQLTVANAHGSDSETKTSYIQVAGGKGEESGTFTDPRDGQTYKWVKIGNQVWMAENLKFLPAVSGYYNNSEATPSYYVYGYGGNDISAAKATAYYQNYGVLYNWPAAMDGASSSFANPSGIQGICPAGWHLPSHDEWAQLEQFVCNELDNANCDTRFPYGYLVGGTLGTEGKALKSCRQVNSPLGGNCNTAEHPRWDASATQFGTDDFGFSALPGGSRYYFFRDIGFRAEWWSSTELSILNAVSRNIPGFTSYISAEKSDKAMGFSVRCLQD